MSTESLQALQTELDAWEVHYRDVGASLSRYERYVLWLRLFRLSRVIMRDYRQSAYARQPRDTDAAYIGDTHRLC